MDSHSDDKPYLLFASNAVQTKNHTNLQITIASASPMPSAEYVSFTEECFSFTLYSDKTQLEELLKDLIFLIEKFDCDLDCPYELSSRYGGLLKNESKSWPLNRSKVQ